VVHHDIEAIDKLPSRYKEVRTLYLSDNNLKSLEGIEQFTSLTSLSLANNLVGKATVAYNR